MLSSSFTLYKIFELMNRAKRFSHQQIKQALKVLNNCADDQKRLYNLHSIIKRQTHLKKSYNDCMGILSPRFSSLAFNSIASSCSAILYNIIMCYILVIYN